MTGSRDLAALGPIAVLGGTGLVGRHVIEALVAAGATEIIATYRHRPPFDGGGRIDWRAADLLEPQAARQALAGARTAILCAGKVSTTAELKRDPVSSVTETLRIGLNALEAAGEAALDRFVLVSSCSGYPDGAAARTEDRMFEGDPPNAWFGVGWVHRFLEKQLEWYSRHLGAIGAAIALRPTLIYGPHDDFRPQSGHFVPSLIHRVVVRERPIEVWGDGNQARNLIHGADVASAIAAVLVRGWDGFTAYNVATQRSASINEVLAALLEIDGFTDAEIAYRPERSAGVGAPEISAAAFSDRFGWQPSVPLRDGLAGTLDWFRKVSNLPR